LDGLGWLLITLIALVFFKSALHRELQGVLLLITHSAEIALALFSLLLFPGVLLHEFSHYLMAKVLRVPTGRFSLIPRRLDGGRLLMGFVETEKVDYLRDALVGAAPFITGSVFVAFVGDRQLGLAALWPTVVNGDLATAFEYFASIYEQNNIWLWFYLLVAVSGTMLPSESDRRAWLPVVVIMALLIGLAWFVGAGPWMTTHVILALNDGLRALAIVLAISGVVHLIVLIPILFLRRIFNRITKFEIR
jgi:hypothetical protein